MKNIIITLIAGLSMVGCTEIEPVRMDIHPAEKDLTALRNYKTGEHFLSITWFSNWKADGNMNTYLNTLPDSLDVIILENNFESLSPAQYTDLETVKQEKGTKVLISQNMDMVYENYQEDLEQAEKEGEYQAEKAAAEKGQEATPEEITESVKKEQDKVLEKYKQTIAALPLKLAEVLQKNGLDGISLRITNTGDAFFREQIYLLFDRIAEVLKDSRSSKLLIFEGYIGYVNHYCHVFDYLINTTHSSDRLADTQEVFYRLTDMKDFSPKQFIAYLSIENDSWKTPYSDLFSSEEITMPKHQSLALWLPAGNFRTGGIALRGIEKDYENNYGILRQTIQFVNLK